MENGDEGNTTPVEAWLELSEEEGTAAIAEEVATVGDGG